MTINKKFLKLLCCPDTKTDLKEKIFENGKKYLVSKLGKKYTIQNRVIKFVSTKNYSKNFGHQWSKFSKTQLDSYSGTNISEKRFFLATGWKKKDVKNKILLDVGCGSGRFSEIALKYGAYVVSVDYSSAVQVAYSNLKKFKKSVFLQSDIYKMPFKNNKFDLIICLGVLQHTPDVETAFKCLPSLLKKNGKLCVDYYWKRPQTMINAKYLFRPLTKNIPNEYLFKIIKILFPLLFFLSNIISLLPYGKYLRRLIPVSNYNGIYNLSKRQHYEWALLDTYDMLAPAYDKPQTVNDVKRWMEECSFKKIKCLHAGHLVVRGIK